MENFTQIDNALFGSDLPGPARLLWIVVKSFERNHSGCYASVARIMERSGYSNRKVFRLWNLLVEKGYGAEERKRGCATIRRVKIPDTPAKTDMSETSTTVQKGHPFLDTTVQNEPEVVYEMAVGSVQNGTHTSTSTITNKKEEQEPPSPPPEVRPIPESPPKAKKTRKNCEIPKSMEAVQAELKSVDLDAFHEKFPNKDVDACWQQFYDTCIGENPRYPRINPRNYHTGYFGKAFGNWLLNARDRPVRGSSFPPRKSRIEVLDDDT